MPTGKRNYLPVITVHPLTAHLGRRSTKCIGHLVATLLRQLTAGHLLSVLLTTTPIVLLSMPLILLFLGELLLLTGELILLLLGELLQNQICLLLCELACGYISIQLRFQGFHTCVYPGNVKGFDGILKVY